MPPVSRLSNHRIRALFPRLLAGVLVGCVGAAIAQSLPTDSGEIVPASAPARSMPADPTANVAIVNWSIFLADVSYKNVNQNEAFYNAFPSFIGDSRRQAAKPKAGDPGAGNADAELRYSPMGMIRISRDGPVNTDLAIDVELSYKNGRPLGEWPHAQTRTASLLWRDVHFASDRETLHELPEGSWLQEARAGSNQTIAVGSTAETFLLYDLEFSYPVELHLAADGADRYKITGGLIDAMEHLTFYRPDPAGGWRSVTIPPANEDGPAAPATAPATGPAKHNRQFGEVAKAVKPATAPATRPAARAAAAATAPATLPAPAVTRDTFTFAGPAAAEGAVFASWRMILADAGVSVPDQDLILKILARRALDPKHVTAVYRLAPKELDKTLPLEVDPQARKVSRIALVIVTGIDPAAAQEMEDWVKQLGDKSWTRRQAAMAALEKYGAAAKPALEKAAKQSNLEIQYRAEQLLQMLSGDPNGAPPGTSDAN
jgi:hypothetical protein